MITIRPEQYAAISLALSGMEQRLLGHIEQFFPDRWRGCGGAEGMRAVLRYGAQRAAVHRFFRPAALADYLSTMLYLGSGFDEAPKFPWARRVLSSSHSDAARGRTLKLTALDFIERAEGENNEHIEAALLRLRNLPVDELLPPPGTQKLTAYIVDRLQFVHPAKCAAIGDVALRKFVEVVLEGAARHRLSGHVHAGIYTAPAFMLGASFDRDPQFPLFERALRDDGGDEEAKAGRLYRAGRAYLDADEI